ncbi:MAG: ABC transporter ATP-binding protein [bacterium]|nr:MAG: ABC transporter ATP-binding protein [bacterium]
MIELSCVTKRYGGVTAVEELTVTVADGEFAVLIGPSGCGKSTTLRMVNRLVPLTSGTIRVDGTDVGSRAPEQLRREMGYVIQSVGLFPHMTVAGNIAVVPSLLKWPRQRTEARVDELLDLFGLDPSSYRDKYPRQLSGGEAQRVGVARALAADPSILLMDEPFGALDPITRETLQTEFSRIQRELGKTIVFVTHDIDEAIRLADRIVILREGRLIQHDTPEKILTHPANRFVLEFIGSDRALKRLSRMKTSDHMRPTASVKVMDSLAGAGAIVMRNGFAWVTCGEGVVRGRLDGQTLTGGAATAGEAMIPVNRGLEVIPADASLREALSRMVQRGLRNAPVADEKGRLVGEISLEDILEA